MIQIAGGVVLNPTQGVAVVNQFGNSWSLPKGHIEGGESTLQAAIREIEEETGMKQAKLRLVRPLGSYVRGRISRDGKGEEPEAQRELHMFLFLTDSLSPLSPRDPDNPEARWVPIEEVAPLLTHPKDKEFFLSMKDELVDAK